MFLYPISTYVGLISASSGWVRELGFFLGGDGGLGRARRAGHYRMCFCALQ